MNYIYSFEAGHIFSPSGFTKLLHFLIHAISLVFPFIIFSTLLLLLLVLIKHILNIKLMLQQEHVFIELTPPAFTEKTAYTTQQLFSVLYTIGNQRSFLDKIIGRKIYFSLEIVSTKEQGIRYLIQTTANEAKVIEHTILSYLPFVR